MNPCSCPLDKNWIASQSLSMILNNQFCPLDSCPRDKELSSGQLYQVDNFMQYFEQPGPVVCMYIKRTYRTYIMADGYEPFNHALPKKDFSSI